jgi:hypothetical protein
MGELAAQARRRLDRAARRESDTPRRAGPDNACTAAAVLQPTVAGKLSAVTGAPMDNEMFGQLQREMAVRVKYRLYSKGSPKRKLSCETMGVHIINRGNHDIFPKRG